MGLESTLSRRLFLQTVATGLGTRLFQPALSIPASVTQHTPITLRVAVASSEQPKINSQPDLSERIGAAHVAGKYSLTKKPFLIEGAEKLIRLGTKVIKLWADPAELAKSYGFNSHWEAYPTAADLIASPYYRKALGMPFSTIFLVTDTIASNNWITRNQTESDYQKMESQSFNLAEVLYKNYGQLAKTFVLQNWEGDWLLSDTTKEEVPPITILAPRVDRMIRGFTAKQKGVERARKQYGANSIAKVISAVEVNRVTGTWKNLPTVTRDVLPFLDHTDLVSYSSWESLDDVSKLRASIEEIQAFATTSSLYGNNQVMVGEIGIAENLVPPNTIPQVWQRYQQLLIDELDLPFVVTWQLYCNENKSKIGLDRFKNNSQAKGYWWLKPDGDKSELYKALAPYLRPVRAVA